MRTGALFIIVEVDRIKHFSNTLPGICLRFFLEMEKDSKDECLVKALKNFKITKASEQMAIAFLLVKIKGGVYKNKPCLLLSMSELVSNGSVSGLP